MTTSIAHALYAMALVIGVGFPAIALLLLVTFWRGGGGRLR